MIDGNSQETRSGGKVKDLLIGTSGVAVVFVIIYGAIFGNPF
ncbi:hypothetical protein ACFO4N_17480 [Camelliibacillus cellulosilyticus]|uniref:YqzM-like protein n=1 Tax=Camelliibacillus cellulosilyticus TaxID=2174486 RepID=A0ABV9GT85_9BACL